MFCLVATYNTDRLRHGVTNREAITMILRKQEAGIPSSKQHTSSRKALTPSAPRNLASIATAESIAIWAVGWRWRPPRRY